MLNLVVALALAGGAPELNGPRWDGRTFRPYVDAKAAIAFDVPMSEALIESRHFDEPKRAAHVLSVIGPSGVEVELDVFNDPREPGAVLDAEMSFLKSPGSSTASVVVARRLPALLIVQPTTSSAYAMRTALFTVGGRLIRVTCPLADDKRARAIFERVLESFAEVRR